MRDLFKKIIISILISGILMDNVGLWVNRKDMADLVNLGAITSCDVGSSVVMELGSSSILAIIFFSNKISIPA